MPAENLVFISLDTTRKDHLSVYGYPRPTSPRLDELAERSAVFLNGVAQWNATKPSHLSMMTGLYPHTHGVGGNATTLPSDVSTLAEILRNEEFRTGGFVSGFPLRKGLTSLDDGFQVYDSKFSHQRRSCKDTTQAALRWLKKKKQKQNRFFLFMHFFDAHGPLHGAEEFLDEFRSDDPGPELDFIPNYQRISDSEGGELSHLNDFVDRYDALIRLQDHCIEQILDAVSLDNTVVVVVADHGETLADRERRYNLNHGTGVFEEQTAIPFIIYSPGRRPGQFALPVETVDLVPTLIDMLAVESPEGLRVQGVSLVPTIDGTSRARKQKQLAFSTSTARFPVSNAHFQLPKHAPIHMVRSTRWKLVVYKAVDGDYIELYDLQRDPKERVNVADQFPDQRDALVKAFNDWRRDMPQTEPDAATSPEVLKNLRALGYLDN